MAPHSLSLRGGTESSNPSSSSGESGELPNCGTAAPCDTNRVRGFGLSRSVFPHLRSDAGILSAQAGRQTPLVGSLDQGEGAHTISLRRFFAFSSKFRTAAAELLGEDGAQKRGHQKVRAPRRTLATVRGAAPRRRRRSVCRHRMPVPGIAGTAGGTDGPARGRAERRSAGRRGTEIIGSPVLGVIPLQRQRELCRDGRLVQRTLGT